MESGKKNGKQNLEDLGVSEAIVNQWGGGNAINAALAGEIPHDYDQQSAHTLTFDHQP